MLEFAGYPTGKAPIYPPSPPKIGLVSGGVHGTQLNCDPPNPPTFPLDLSRP